MKLEEKDIEMFQNLHGSNTGEWLVDYLGRLCGWVCDVRNKGIGTPETREAVAQVLTEQMIAKVTLQTPRKEAELNKYR